MVNYCASFVKMLGDLDRAMKNRRWILTGTFRSDSPRRVAGFRGIHGNRRFPRIKGEKIRWQRQIWKHM
jgi:hypothetical protein